MGYLKFIWIRKNVCVYHGFKGIRQWARILVEKFETFWLNQDFIKLPTVFSKPMRLHVYKTLGTRVIKKLICALSLILLTFIIIAVYVLLYYRH